MKSISVLWIPVCVFLACCCIGCDSGDQQENPGDTDTRVLVRNAFDSIDMKSVGVHFNMKRAGIIRKEMDQEKDAVRRLSIGFAYGLELLKGGETGGAISILNGMLNTIDQNKIPMDSASKRELYSNLAIAYMRQGEIENCVQNHNHQSCFIPIAGGGIHKLQSGSRQAIDVYLRSLKEFPNDLENIYLAYMTIGEYPAKVPAEYRIDPAWFTNKVKIQPFTDIAPQLGVNKQSMAGGTIVDDFNNDGWLDILATSWGPYEELSFYINNGDGTFSDQTKAWKLDGQVGSLNVNQTDFNNDGWLDIFLMRGAWYRDAGDIPGTLLMNTGKGYFEDVTFKSGLTHKAASQNAAWADYNLDGWLDLVIGNESWGEYQRGIEIYINQKDGTFSHQKASHGLTESQYFKGCIASDLNNDRYPDIYFSGIEKSNYLYVNHFAENRGFQMLGPEVKVREPNFSFPCFSFDYDNDGHEDIFVSAFNNEGTPGKYWMLSHMGKPDPAFLPRLYHNKGNLNFDEVGSQMGLNEVVFTMGCNFGDINTDGYLDFYLATGNPLYQSLVPNKMYLNMDGKRFEDVSYSGGFANIQKGHGVGFGDLDHDGDEDIYVVIGGGYDGDGFYNCLFENPNEHQNNWVVLKLTGTNCNKPAIGARVTLSVQENGQERKIYRTVSSGASFGANSLALEVGLRKSTTINSVTVQWPCRDCPDQVYSGLQVNKAYNLTEGDASAKEITYSAVKMTGGGGSGHTHH